MILRPDCTILGVAITHCVVSETIMLCYITVSKSCPVKPPYLFLVEEKTKPNPVWLNEHLVSILFVLRELILVTFLQRITWLLKVPPVVSLTPLPWPHLIWLSASLLSSRSCVFTRNWQRHDPKGTRAAGCHQRNAITVPQNIIQHTCKKFKYVVKIHFKPVF